MRAYLAELFFALICLDMGIKQYVEKVFQENEERETILDKVVLRKVYNEGFAFGLLKDKPKIIKAASVFAGLGVIAYNVRLFQKKGRRFEKLGMTLVSAGAFSNIYDRLIRGKVIDYIGVQSRIKLLSSLTANLADLYVAAGAALVSLVKRR